MRRTFRREPVRVQESQLRTLERELVDKGQIKPINSALMALAREQPSYLEFADD